MHPDTAPRWKDDGFLRALGAPFTVAQPPQPLPQAHWVARNDALADALGWHGWLESDDALALLAGNAEPPGGTLASVYSGHQFGVWAGQLGDGRALLVGEADTPLGPMEVQVKGAGLTPYSRMGDGRAVLRSSVREYLCSEAMHSLGIPTTRALALAGSPLPVRRETVETAAVVTRVAPSFLRFGHFEHFTHTARDLVALQRLTDAARRRYFPGIDDARGLLEAVSRRTARLVAQWQAVGFCHGVMNTDNMSLLGLTIDYGPFGFLDGFDPGHICNHSDHQGRYAYARQPNVAFWNLHALAQALLPLIEDEDAARDALEAYKTEYESALLAALRAKLGLRDAHDDDRALADDLLQLMAAGRSDFTLTFRLLATPAAARDHFIDREGFDAWNTRYTARLAAESSAPGADGDADRERALRMNAVNPRYVLRNHLAETAIRLAAEGDFSEVERLLRVLQRPFDDQPRNAGYAALPPDWAQHLEVSCSS